MRFNPLEMGSGAKAGPEAGILGNWLGFPSPPPPSPRSGQPYPDLQVVVCYRQQSSCVVGFGVIGSTKYFTQPD